MPNVMQYLLQMSDEFRESYTQIDKRLSETLDKLDLVEYRLRDLEARIINADKHESDQYNKLAVVR